MLLILALLAAIFWLPMPWGVIVVIVAAVWEIAEVSFFVWYSKRRRAAIGVETLPGSTGTVVVACRPLGQVRVEGELWGARCEEGADPGDRIVVEALGPDLTLLVRRA